MLVGHWGCPPLTADMLAQAPNLRRFAYAAGTVKWQVTDAVWERGIVVTSAAAANAVPVAEYTVAMILLANKGALIFRERLRDPTTVAALPAHVGNVDKRVGLVGASLVGRHVIELLRPYSLRVSVYDPYLEAGEARELGVEKVDDLERRSARPSTCSVCMRPMSMRPGHDRRTAALGAPRRSGLHQHRSAGAWSTRTRCSST